MKKLFILLFIPTLLLCGCRKSENTKSQNLIDTVCTITADCSEESLNGVFELCEKYDRLLGASSPDNEISMINHYDEMELSPEIIEMLAQSIYYCQKTGGKYDITIAPAAQLYDFENQIAPPEAEAKRVLYKVGYNRIEIKGNWVDLHNTDIDLSSIVNGYITDKLLKSIKADGAKNGSIKVGNSTAFFGRAQQFEINKPASSQALLTIKLKNKAVATTSIYDRCFEKAGKFYHHIIDVNTGLPLETELAAVTVIGERASECDVLSTVCMILGEKVGKTLINQTEGYEAVFIKKDNSVSVSNGLKLKKNTVVYK
jgi:thiamine biosynthesis lipoprotein